MAQTNNTYEINEIGGKEKEDMRIVITNTEVEYSNGYQGGVTGILISFTSHNEGKTRDYVNGAISLTEEEYNQCLGETVVEQMTLLSNMIAGKLVVNPNPEESEA